MLECCDVDGKHVSSSCNDNFFFHPIMISDKCGALHDFIPFLQFKKREKHSSMGVFQVF